MMLDTHVRVVVVVGCGALLVLAIARRRTMLAQNRVLPRLLEHINLNIPSQTTAREFYVGLGGAINPVSTNWRQLHINIGASQWHLLHSLSRPDATPPGEAVQVPQTWPGFAVLWTTEPLPRMRDRLARIRATSPPTGPPPVSRDAVGMGYGLELGWPMAPMLSADGTRLQCSCPWGNRYEVRAAPAGFAPEGMHPGGTGTLVALRQLVHPIQAGAGAAAALVNFFTEVLGMPSTLSSDAMLDTPSCVVPFASGQTLEFVEAEDAPAADAYVRDEPGAGYHLACYTASHKAFETAFAAAERAGCLYKNERFEGGRPEFGNAMMREVALGCGQFRVRDVRDANGRLVLMLELEVRSPRHISCPLFANNQGA